jgi:hypothetical protein
MKINLLRKDASVNLDLHPAFVDAARVIRTAFIMTGTDAMVTSGRDGKHSTMSAHYKGQAIDLRIKHLPFGSGPSTVGFRLGVENFAFRLANALEQAAGAGWYVVYETDHLHVEYAEPGQAPNIKAYKPGRNFYAEAA